MQIHICEPEFLANMLASTLVLWRVSRVRGPPCVAQVDLKFPILPQPPMRWDYRHTPLTIPSKIPMPESLQI